VLCTNIGGSDRRWAVK